jgi:hypothetical protein
MYDMYMTITQTISQGSSISTVTAMNLTDLKGKIDKFLTCFIIDKHTHTIFLMQSPCYEVICLVNDWSIKISQKNSNLYRDLEDHVLYYCTFQNKYQCIFNTYLRNILVKKAKQHLTSF